MRPTRMTIAGIAALGAALMAASAHAGDGNQVYIKQESPPLSSNGNSLSIDQSQAFDSVLSGPSGGFVEAAQGMSPGVNLEPLLTLSRAGPDGIALQRGEGNLATLTISGTGGELQILQDSTSSEGLVAGTGGGNTATATVIGNGLGVIIQEGQLNQAGLLLRGNDASGLIAQFGTNLQTSLTVEGGGTGQVIQRGEGNNTGPIEVSSGGTVTYTQIGNNLQPIGTTGVQVISTINAGNISITQTGF